MHQNISASWTKTDRILAWISLCLVFLVGTGCKERDKPVSESPDEATSAVADVPERDRLRELHPQPAGIHNQRWLRNDSTLLSFCLYVPEGIELEPEVPLVLFLHPGSQTYTPFFARDMVNNLVVPMLGDTRAIVVAPDILDNSWTSEESTEQVMAILEEVCKTYPVDRDRILATGYSIGASGVWHFVSRAPDVFTAALPIAGGPSVNYAEFKWRVPMLCLHSTADEVFPVANVRKAVDELRKNDETIELIEINDASHYSLRAFIEPGQKALARIKEIWGRKAKDDPPVQADQ